VGIVTVGRSDYGIYLPVLRALQATPELRLELFVTGMHLSAAHGNTVEAIERDGFPIAARIPTLSDCDTPEAVARAIAAGVAGFAAVFAQRRPDILVVLGDRFEMYAAAIAALPFTIPVAHIHGGEVTQGAIDDALRHSMTKLSHLHFVSTEAYARRVQQLGEEPWRITVTGAPSLDNLAAVRVLSRAELETALGFALESPALLVTYHPVTLQHEQTEHQCRELLAALEEAGAQVIFTLPNADTGGRAITQLIREFIRRHPKARLVENLGTELYFSLMEHASAMVGNSSSGLIEAPSFALPVVNIGLRQAGRVRGANVIDVAHDRASIFAGVQRAVAPAFRASLDRQANPYRAGKSAAANIVNKLMTVELDDRLLVKRFHDFSPP
jgi:UDP-hydrolysing UDP-N-acetyl-D-glucosamine 2-epimerase